MSIGVPQSIVRLALGSALSLGDIAGRLRPHRTPFIDPVAANLS